MFPAHTGSHRCKDKHEHYSEVYDVPYNSNLANIGEIYSNAGNAKGVRIASCAYYIECKATLGPEHIQRSHIHLMIVCSYGGLWGGCIAFS